MYLAELSINGFKSFASKTRLEFSKGLTSIVGPNGSGKSNIVDAIRWVIGEQKSSVLRSDKMLDVIFNGNNKRKPLGMAEVTLKIVNDQGVLPSEYTDVLITRRIFQSGQSEYLLNNRTCRLKDIQELFTDTGMGADAYSVIELKMVEQILSTNANERRQLFEEAAGIKKYKHRRKSALRKLEDTRQNMLRVDDIIIEVEQKVKSLERQVKKVSQYREHKDSLRQMEITAAAFNFHQYQERMDPLQEELNQAKQHQQDHNNQISLDEALLENLKAEQLQTESLLSGLRRELFDLDESIRELREADLVASEQRSNAEQIEQRISVEIADMKKRIAQRRNEIDQLQAQLERTREQRENVESEHADKTEQMNARETRFQAARIAMREAEQSHQQTEQQLRDARDELRRQETRLIHLDERLTDIGAIDPDQLAALKSDLQNRNSLVENAREAHQKTESAIQQNQADVDALRTQLEAIRESLRDARRRFEAAESRKRVYENMLNSGELLPEEIRRFSESAATFDGYIGLLSDAIQFRKELPDYAARAISHYGSLPVFKPTNESVLIEQLQAFAPIRCIVLKDQSVNVSENSIATFVESDILTSSDIAQIFGKLQLKGDSGVQIRTHGVIDHDSSIMTVFPGDQQSVSIFTAQAEIEKLAEQVRDIQAEINPLEAQIESRQQQLSTLNGAQNALRDTLRDAQNALAEAIRNRDEIQIRLDQLEQQQTQNQEVHRQLTQERLNIAARIDPLTQQVAELEGKRTQTAADLNTAVETFNQLEAERDQFQRAYQEVHLKTVELRNQEQRLEDRLRSTSTDIRTAQETISRRETEIETLQAQQKKRSEETGERETKLADFSSQREQRNSEKLNVEERYLKAKQDIEEIEKNIRQTHKRRDEHRENVQRLELKLNELTIKAQTIGERMYHDYQVDIKSIRPPVEFDLMMVEKEIFRTKQRIASLGEVNALAEEEFRQEDERLKFLTQQRDDLKNSESLLLDTIETINQTATQQFDETFSEIRDNFKRVFHQFFPNGNANLELIDPDHPLDSDVDIKVSPKGRSLQTIALMSGGEKTLTAISLLFSIYLVKPSPFCILDEVDAPLDDINIGRFTQALRAFTDRTQFIIITHNKGTMESSDYMYGVTQEEVGVSKLVSVSMNG